MKLEGGFLESRVARRIFLLFLASAIVPVLAFGAYSFFHVRDQLQEQSLERIEETSRRLGMALVEKLQFLSIEMDLVANQFTAAPDLDPSSLVFSRERFSAFCDEREGVLECFHGSMTEPGALSEDQVQHIQSGEPTLVTIPASESVPGRFIFGLELPLGENPVTLWAEPDLNALLNIDPGGRFSTNLELFVLGANRELLYTSLELTEAEKAVIQSHFAEPHSNAATLGIGNATYNTMLRELPLGRQFGLRSIAVVVAQSEDEVLAPVRQFQRIFPFFLLASLLLVAFLSSNQIRRSLDPLERLMDGTARIAQADFSTRVAVDSRDEFQDLAESFNSMALQIGIQFDTLEAVAEIDREILSAFHTDDIVLTALGRIPALVGSSQICVAITDFDRPTQISVFASNGLPNEEVAAIEKQMPASFWDRLQGKSEGILVSADDPLTPRQLANPRLEPCEALAVPISVKQQVVGALILGFKPDVVIEPEMRRRAAQFSNQLAVALSNAHLLEEMDELNLSTLTALARTVDAKSPWTAGHSERVTRLAVQLARKLGVPQTNIERINRGGLLHDIGKIGIPAEILDKPGRLTPAEFAVMKQHPVIGAKILEPVKAFADVLPMVRSHHERIDGKGYPDGLAGDAVPFDVRILTVSDVFDALYSDRPYRGRKGFTDVLEMIREGAGTQFDPVVVDAFLELAQEQRHFLVNSFTAERDRQYNIFPT
ncbi:MAG: HD domain-containing protein [Acidobacteriota bacterium]|nr:MAG: HD domain-containing protein [Acidobacteriota bacterium]